MDYGQPVRFGVFLTPDGSQPSHLLELSALADELGFDLVGVQDHPYQRRFLDTWTLLTWVAAQTASRRPLRHLSDWTGNPRQRE